jgi:hypothetical protein
MTLATWNVRSIYRPGALAKLKDELKIFEGKIEGRRGRGRPRLRWTNDVEDDLRKLGVKRWRTKALDRVEWASIIREAKAKLKGPWRYRKKKKKKKL